MIAKIVIPGIILFMVYCAHSICKVESDADDKMKEIMKQKQAGEKDNAGD